jgi:hypothetical protein
MSITLPTSIPTPIIGGRWLDKNSGGLSLVVLSPEVLLATGAEWYLTGGTNPASLSALTQADWSGPVETVDGAGLTVQVFTVNTIAGVAVNRYSAYYYTVGQRDPANPTTSFVHSATSGGGYPTSGWNSGVGVISPRATPNVNASPAYNVTWDAVTGVDFSKTYVVQYALGKTAPASVVTTSGSVMSAQGTSEADVISNLGIQDFYTYQETTATTVPLNILSSDPTQWTWFRVLAYSSLWGYTSVFAPGASSVPWLGVTNDPKLYTVQSNTGTVVVGEPASSTSTTNAGVSDPVSAASLPLETNLPMLMSGIGGVTHMRGKDTLHQSVRWREGILVLNADQSVSASHTTRRWGIRFHYNPSTWNQSSAIAQDIDLTTYAQTGGNLLLPTAFSTVDFTIYLNRIIELSQDIDPLDPAGVALRAHQLSAIDFNPGSGDGAPQASIAPVSPSTRVNGNGMGAGGSAPATVGTINETVADKITAVLQKGTLADIEYLYRACNGDPVSVTHTTEKTADIGMLAMTILDLYLGPNIRYTVRVANMSVQHMMFSNRMIPTFSQVQLSLIRGITMGTAGSAVSVTDVGNLTNLNWTNPTSTTGSTK